MAKNNLELTGDMLVDHMGKSCVLEVHNIGKNKTKIFRGTALAYIVHQTDKGKIIILEQVSTQNFENFNLNISPSLETR